MHRSHECNVLTDPLNLSALATTHMYVVRTCFCRISSQCVHFYTHVLRSLMVESLFILSSLSSVTPPDIWYRLMLPKEVTDNCYLSALQLEAVVYACQQHETFLADGTRAGFLIGNKFVMKYF